MEADQIYGPIALTVRNEPSANCMGVRKP